MRLYFIYEKSPKKCRGLEEVIEELKAGLGASKMSAKGGTRPLRACGTRFVGHKVKALERVIEKFGAYIAHLIALTKDSTVLSADRQKLKGYVLKWQISQVLMGCAIFMIY